MSSWSSSKTSLGTNLTTSKEAAASADHGDSATIGPLPASKAAPRMIGPSMGPVRVTATAVLTALVRFGREGSRDKVSNLCRTKPQEMRAYSI